MWRNYTLCGIFYSWWKNRQCNFAEIFLRTWRLGYLNVHFKCHRYFRHCLMSNPAIPELFLQCSHDWICKLLAWLLKLWPCAPLRHRVLLWDVKIWTLNKTLLMLLLLTINVLLFLRVHIASKHFTSLRVNNIRCHVCVFSVFQIILW